MAHEIRIEHTQLIKHVFTHNERAGVNIAMAPSARREIIIEKRFALLKKTISHISLKFYPDWTETLYLQNDG